MTIDQLKAYKRKARAQRDNWKRRYMEQQEKIALYCWEKRGHFASDVAARMFGDLIRAGYYETEAGK
jgi:hypothetical protein